MQKRLHTYIYSIILLLTFPVMYLMGENAVASLSDSKVEKKHTSASHPRCKVRVFWTENGLPAGELSGLTQSTDNLIWMTSWNGMSCYDGYRFSTFRNIPGKDILPTNHLKFIFPGSKGNLWTSTYTGEMYMFDSKKCEYVNVSKMICQSFNIETNHAQDNDPLYTRKLYPLANGHSWLVSYKEDHYRVTDTLLGTSNKAIEHFKFAGTLHKVCLDEKGREWCFTDKATYVDGKKYSSQCYDFVAVQNGKTWLEPKAGRNVYSFLAIDNNHLALATDDGVVIIDTRTGKEQKVSVHSPGSGTGKVIKIYLDSHRRLWCFTDGMGVTLLTLNGGDVKTQWLNARLANVDDETRSEEPLFHEDSHHTVWVIPTNGTFSYYDEARGELVAYSLRDNTPEGLFVSLTKNYFSDVQGNLWLIHPHTLSLINFLYNSVNTIERGDNKETRAVMQASDGTIWAGTIDGTLLQYDAHSNTPKSIKKNFAKNIYVLFEDSHHNKWVGSKADGLFLLSHDGTTKHFCDSNADKYSLNSDKIYDIKEDKLGRLWIATFDGGLNCAVPLKDASGKVQYKFYNSGNGLKGYDGEIHKKVRRIEILTNGVALISTTTGLLTFDTRKQNLADIQFYMSHHMGGNEKSLYSTEVMQTCGMRDGRVYVATLGGGLQQITSKNLLQDNIELKGVDTNTIQTIFGLVPDNEDNLWIIGESRIARLKDGKEGPEVELYGADAMGDVNLTEALPSHNRKSDLIVLATEGGLLTFRPADMKKSNFQPTVVFTAVNYQDNLGMQPLLNTDKLSVDVDHRTFSIYFSALDYNDNSNIRYAYRLDDSDEWVYTRPGINSVSFSDFPAGNHILYVRSTNSDGVWMDNVRELHIYAQPTFFESWWGRTIIAIIIIGLICYAIYRYMQKQKKEISEEATEKADAGKVRFLLQTPEIIDEDKAMMDNLLVFIEKNISDPDIKVEDLAASVNLSRSVFYAKMKKMADMSPTDFLRHVRMQRAEDLVAKSQMSFSQIAYQVGFTDPKYFGKCFKKHTGQSPSEYRATNADKE